MKRILSHTAAVRSALEAFLQEQRKTANPELPWQADFLDRLLPFATAGKLLRGSLVCFGYEAFAGRPRDSEVMKAAMALELTHSALLIHDDIMDNDELRRGRPSLHRQYRSLGEDEGLAQGGHFGLSMAMSGGDMALFLAFDLLAGCRVDPTARRAALRLYTDQLAVTCAGQMQDLYLETRPGIPSKQTIYALMEAKTASYTIGLPLAMGAALAGQPPAKSRQLQVIGRLAGTIFQIRDDELGVMGSTVETGKPVGSDITEGKKTLLYYYLLRQCGPEERERIAAIFGRSADASDISLIRKLVRECGVAASINDEISRLERQARAHIEKLAVSSDTRQDLLELVRFCGQRHA